MYFHYNKFDSFVNNVMFCVYLGGLTGLTGFSSGLTLSYKLSTATESIIYKQWRKKRSGRYLLYYSVLLGIFNIMTTLQQLPIQFSSFIFARYPGRQLQEYDPTEFTQSIFRPHEPLTAHSSLSALTLEK